MCQHGETVRVHLGGKSVLVDRCLSDLLLTLNATGRKTIESCCGHGSGKGIIVFEGGGKWIMFEDRDAWIRHTAPIDIANNTPCQCGHPLSDHPYDKTRQARTCLKEHQCHCLDFVEQTDKETA